MRHLVLRVLAALARRCSLCVDQLLHAVPASTNKLTICCLGNLDHPPSHDLVVSLWLSIMQGFHPVVFVVPTLVCPACCVPCVLQGFDPVFGARPVKRALQRELQTLLAQALLRGEFVEGDTILVEAAPDGTCLTLRKGSSSSTRQQLQQLTGAKPPTAAAAAANGDVNGDAAAGGGAPVPPGKKKVIRLVKKKSSGSGQLNGAANGSAAANGKAANGQVMSRSSSSGGLQSVPLPLGDAAADSDAE
eukprot:GHRQ01024463.1.p1 GENE.GHRQ01024463.1~~GHRQ01024463.1.p1  ORF type:complete len:247 (+),score=108.05 GHRQ01024463.1:501-1241(+)